MSRRALSPSPSIRQQQGSRVTKEVKRDRNVLFLLPATLGPPLLMGPLYLKWEGQWLLGTAALYATMMVHTVPSPQRTTALQVADVTTLKCLNFLNYFDNFVFEVTTERLVTPLLSSPGSNSSKRCARQSKLTRQVDTFTFRAPDSVSMFEWLGGVEDAQQGDELFFNQRVVLPTPKGLRSPLPVFGEKLRYVTTSTLGSLRSEK